MTRASTHSNPPPPQSSAQPSKIVTNCTVYSIVYFVNTNVNFIAHAQAKKFLKMTSLSRHATVASLLAARVSYQTTPFKPWKPINVGSFNYDVDCVGHQESSLVSECPRNDFIGQKTSKGWHQGVRKNAKTLRNISKETPFPGYVFLLCFVPDLALRWPKCACKSNCPTNNGRLSRPTHGLATASDESLPGIRTSSHNF